MTQFLVSVIIYNYNYGRFLHDCFNSVLSQTYPNIEILFSDNASQDNSWEIALDYQSKFPNRIFVARNHTNFGTDANFRNCIAALRGKYFLVLGSDDVIHRDYISIAVRYLDTWPDVAFVMAHRYILDGFGTTSSEAPFYNGNYKLFPPSQAVVYMMAAVNPSISQVIYRKEPALARCVQGSFASQYYGTRIMDFRLCLEFPVIYLSDALVGHRIHGINQSLEANSNLMEIIGPYVLNFQFAELARPFGFSKVTDKLEPAKHKLSTLALRYSRRAFHFGHLRLATQYLHLSAAIDPDSKDSAEYTYLNSLISGDGPLELSSELPSLEFQRTTSYDPEPPFDKIA